MCVHKVAVATSASTPRLRTIGMAASDQAAILGQLLTIARPGTKNANPSASSVLGSPDRSAAIRVIKPSATRPATKSSTSPSRSWEGSVSPGTAPVCTKVAERPMYSAKYGSWPAADVDRIPQWRRGYNDLHHSRRKPSGSGGSRTSIESPDRFQDRLLRTEAVRVKERLIVAVAAAMAVTGVVGWGLLSAAAKGPVTRAGASASHRSAARRPLSLTPRVVTKPGWRLTFDGRFTGSKLDAAVWATCYPWMDVPTGCTNFGNPEHQWYLPSQDRVSGGVLHIVAKRVPTEGTTKSGAPELYPCRSGMVTTYPSYNFKYGYVQVVARLPAQTMWSAFWLAASNLRWPPEMDFLEAWGKGHTRSYYHPVGTQRSQSPLITANLSTSWHTFGLMWSAHKMTTYIDGRPTLTVRNRVAHQKMYLIIDMAANRTQLTCSGTLLVRSVRVWQHESR